MKLDELRGHFPENRVIVDQAGSPSVMVYFPKYYLDEVIDGAAHLPHPAFVVDGRELDGIYLSKFQNVIVDGLAYSLPGEDPATKVTFDGAVRACADKGRGHHLMSAMEWGAVALWCQKNGTLPFGNNDVGKDVREDAVVAKLSYRDEERSIYRTATGTGPVTWSHNHREDGIYDLNGNVWEWVGGLRLVFGEVQILSDNNGAVSQGADSAAWRAIDGTCGKLLIPDGRGTTENSVKLDFADGHWRYVTGSVTDTLAKARFCELAEVDTAPEVCNEAKTLLYALGCLCCRSDGIEGVSLYANNGAEERMAFRGGRWGQGLNAGVFKTCLDDPRTYAGEAVGFRSAYYES